MWARPGKSVAGVEMCDSLYPNTAVCIIVHSLLLIADELATMCSEISVGVT